ncbi:MAG: hypothetical protein ACRBHB_11150 [Arenicella sp.]
MNLAFLSVFLIVLFLPGFAVVKVCERFGSLQHKRYLISVAFSYAIFTLALIVAQHYSISRHNFYLFQLFLLLLSTLTIVLMLWKERFKISSMPSLVRRDSVFILLPVLVAVYHLLVGPYDEIPADIYAHLGYFQTALEQQGNDQFGFALPWSKLLMQKGLVWYHLLAFVQTTSGSTVEQTLFTATLLTKTAFLLGVYALAKNVFASHRQVQLIALLTTVLLALHMGINVMAYIRYYSFAPTMLNFVLYMAAIAVFMHAIKRGSWQVLFAAVCFILLVVAASAAIHTQEALFILLMIALVSLAEIAMRYWSDTNSADVLTWLPRFLPYFIVAGAFLCFAVLYWYAHTNWDRAPNIGWRLWEFGLLADWLPRISILNAKYQFVRVLTLWGLLVSVLFVFFWRDFRNYPYLLAGMFSPLVTVFNPFFTDLFLRLDDSTTLWRLCYLMPLHFVGALAIVILFNGLREKRWILFGNVSAVVALLALVILLLPIKNTFLGLHYSRLPTLIKVAPENNAQHLEDALATLDGIKKKHTVLTDPVTGYVVHGLTHHNVQRHKFFARRYLNFTFEDYSNDPLKVYRGKLLLVNRRSQALSEVGGLSRHWPANVLQLGRYYPDALLDYLDKNPELFQQLWTSDSGDMLLYKIL